MNPSHNIHVDLSITYIYKMYNCTRYIPSCYSRWRTWCRPTWTRDLRSSRSRPQSAKSMDQYVINRLFDNKSGSFVEFTRIYFRTISLYFQEAAWFVADEAIQILGGMGYMRVGIVYVYTVYIFVLYFETRNFAR